MTIRGWCPSLYEPMASGDGLLVRVSPPAARVSPAAAHALADAAARWGNGTIELTRRGNVQIRGLRSNGVAPFAAAMVAAGLADPDPAAERRRIVVPPPLVGDDPAVPDDGITAALEGLIPPGLPPKFCVAIDGGGALPGAPAADIVIRRGPGGWDKTIAAVAQCMQDAVSQIRPARHPSAVPSAIGFLPYGDGYGAFGVGLPFGQTDAAGLHALAALFDRFGAGTIRTSPWRALLLGRAAAADVDALRAATMLDGWIIDAADSRRLVTACIGSPACASGLLPARADAAAAGVVSPIHYSGCIKGCAYPGGPAMVAQSGGYVRVETWRPGTPV